MRPLQGKKYKVAVIGCGSHGTRLARGFDVNPLTEVVCAVNRGQEGLDLFCNRFGGIRGYNDYREMLAKEDPDIVCLGLPVNVNPEVVIACSKKKSIRGIFSEKPIAVSLGEGDAAVAACKQAGIPWAAGDMFRNDPELWRARRQVEAGEIGKVEAIDIYGAGGNQMSGQGCRQFTDAFMFVNDSELDWAIGQVGGWAADTALGRIDEHSDGDQDILWGHIGFKNGVEAYVHKNVSTMNGVLVHGTKGMLYVSHYRVLKYWKSNGLYDLDYAGSGIAFPDSESIGKKTEYDADGWQVQTARLLHSVQALIDAVDKGTPVLCSGEDNLKALEAVIGIRESHRRGVTKVKFPLEDRSLKVIPYPRRMVGRRASESTEAFLKHIKDHKKAVSSG